MLSDWLVGAVVADDHQDHYGLGVTSVDWSVNSPAPNTSVEWRHILLSNKQLRLGKQDNSISIRRQIFPVYLIETCPW